MVHKITNTENHLLVLGKNYKSDSFPYIVAEKLTTGDYQLWQVDNPNDWDEPNQFEILAHLPLGQAPILEGVPLLPSLRDDSRCDVDVICKQEAETLHDKSKHEDWDIYNELVSDDAALIKRGYNKSREKYIEEPIEKLWEEFRIQHPNTVGGFHEQYQSFAWLFNKMNGKQYPTEFECEMIPCNPIKYTTEDHLDVEPKTITTAQGVQWVGKYL